MQFTLITIFWLVNIAHVHIQSHFKLGIIYWYSIQKQINIVIEKFYHNYNMDVDKKTVQMETVNTMWEKCDFRLQFAVK